MRAHLKSLIKDCEKFPRDSLDGYNIIDAIKKNRFTSPKDNCEEGRLGAAAPPPIESPLHAFPPISCLHLQSRLYLPSNFQEIVREQGRG